MPEPRDITLSIWIAKPAERVWRALTHAEELGRWLAQKAEPLENGFRLGWPHHSFDVTILDSREPEALEISWFNQNGVGPTVRFELTEINNGCTVKLTHRGFDVSSGDGAFVDHVEGWTMYLCNLRCYLDFDSDLRTGQPPGTVAM